MSPAADRQSFGDRLVSTLTDDLPAIATGIIVAMPVAYGLRSWTDEFAVSFFVLILGGVTVPGLIDRYSPGSGIQSDVLWTVVGCVVVFTVFLGLFTVLGEVAAGIVAAATAFIVVSLGGPLLLAYLTNV